MDWCRLWHDMPTDPKWRTIARKSGQRVGDVVAVWNFMMVCASIADERGHLQGWDDEDVATALDIDPEGITAIRDAMQGKVLDGDRLTGWEKRQPKRERQDNSAERVANHRKRQQKSEKSQDGSDDAVTPRNDSGEHVTPCNTKKRLDEIRGEKIREEQQSREATVPAAAEPEIEEPEAPPPVFIELGNRILDELGIDPTRWTGSFHDVQTWINRGDDPEKDIIPAVQDTVRRNGEGWKPKSLRYFNDIISEWRQRRENPDMPDIPAHLRRGSWQGDTAKSARIKRLKAAGFTMGEIISEDGKTSLADSDESTEAALKRGPAKTPEAAE